MQHANIQKTHHITVIRFYSSLRGSSFTHILIPNLKKYSKETQPTQHSANSQCQSPTSRNDTYRPSQHTICPCHGQDIGRPDMSREADVSWWPAVMPCSACSGSQRWLRVRHSQTRLSESTWQKVSEICEQEWIRLCGGRHITQGLQASHYGFAGWGQPATKGASDGRLRKSTTKQKEATACRPPRRENRTSKRRDEGVNADPINNCVQRQGPRPYLTITLLIFLKVLGS